MVSAMPPFLINCRPSGVPSMPATKMFLFFAWLSAMMAPMAISSLLAAMASIGLPLSSQPETTSTASLRCQRALCFSSTFMSLYLAITASTARVRSRASSLDNAPIRIATLPR